MFIMKSSEAADVLCVITKKLRQWRRGVRRIQAELISHSASIEQNKGNKASPYSKKI